MKPVLANSLGQMMAALGMRKVPNVPGDLAAANQIALQNLILQKIMIAALDVGIDWDTYEMWVEPGLTPTKLCNVNDGDIVVIKMINHDVDYAETVFYDQSPGVRPSPNLSSGFPITQIAAGTNFWDFNEGGPNFAATITAATYSTGVAMANAIQAAMNAAVPFNTYAVRWIDASNVFEIEATNAGAIPFWIVPATGPNSANSIGPQIGWTQDDNNVIPPATARSNTAIYFAAKVGDEQAVGHPLLAGDQDVVVLESSLYGILDPNYGRRVPLSIRRSRIVARNRG
jgi:hypothetical protein